MNKPLQQSILKTLAYFDTFEYPLIANEVHRWLFKPDGVYSISAVNHELDILKQQNKIQQQQGFYFFDGKSSNIDKRLDAYLLVKQKMNIAKKAARIIRHIPFVQALFVCNTVAGATPSQESDIDVLIVIDDTHLWVSRFLVTLFLAFFRLRRTKNNVHNKICLSFYITKSASNFETIQIINNDIYLAYWVDQLIPIYDNNNYLLEIYKKNKWLHKKLPHALTDQMIHSNWKIDQTIFSKIIKKTGEILIMLTGGYLEKILKKIQKKKMDKNVGSLQYKDDSRVIINDNMLKFHENDRRIYFKKRWIDRCNELGI